MYLRNKKAMKKIFFILVFMTSMYSYSQEYQCVVEPIEKGEVKIEVIYYSRTILLNDLLEKKVVQLWSDKRFEEESSQLPKQGVAFFKIYGSSIENGNPSFYEFLVQDSINNEILRRNGNDNIPKPYISKYRPTEWFGVEYLVINEKVGATFPIYVFDLSNQRWKFIIHSNQIIPKPKH